MRFDTRQNNNRDIGTLHWLSTARAVQKITQDMKRFMILSYVSQSTSFRSQYILLPTIILAEEEGKHDNSKHQILFYNVRMRFLKNSNF